MATRRNARAEAAATLGPEWRPALLEPSPPAVSEEPYLADDPLVPLEGTGTVVLPLGQTDDADVTTWAAMVESQPDLGLFAQERWLANWRELKLLPGTYPATRLALHKVAAYVVSPARRAANGKIGLRYVRDGFGTPFYANGNVGDTQIRVEGTELIRQRGSDIASAPLTTLGGAADTLRLEVDLDWAAEYDIPPAGDLGAPLDLDPIAAAALADWFGFAFSVLEELRADEESLESSRPQLWPEHFDPAIEIGSDEAHSRARFGLSPGDAADGHREPYLYVSAWYPEDLTDNPFWNSEAFPGAMLHYRDLLAADDQREAALAFFRQGRDLLLAEK